MGHDWAVKIEHRSPERWLCSPSSHAANVNLSNIALVSRFSELRYVTSEFKSYLDACQLFAGLGAVRPKLVENWLVAQHNLYTQHFAPRTPTWHPL